MGAKLFVNLPVLSLGEEMQIDFPHNRAVLIRIAHELLRSVRGCDAEMIIEVARRAGHSRAKETVAMNFFGSDRFFRHPVQGDVDLAGVGAENADLQIIAHPVRSQNPERIGMRSVEKPVQFIGRQSRDLERFHEQLQPRSCPVLFKVGATNSIALANVPTICDDGASCQNYTGSKYGR